MKGLTTILGLVSMLLVLQTAPAFKFVSTDKDHTVLQGDPVTMQCAIEGLSPMTKVVMSNNSIPQSLDAEFYGDETRAIVEESIEGNRRTYLYTIYSAELRDEGEYTCTMFGFNAKQIYRVTVNIPPEIFTDEEPQQQVELGGTTDLTCRADGKPVPVITWSKKGGTLPTGELELGGETLTLTDMQKGDGGVYQCQANNGAGQPDTQSFVVGVIYEPSVSVQEQFIHTGPGNEVIIRCVFDANPPVNVMWYHNDNDINLNDKPHITIDTIPSETPEMSSVLRITDIKESDMGYYRCSGANELGQADLDVEVSAMPHSLEILSDEESRYSDQYDLEWRWVSVPEPVECDLTVSEITDNGTIIFGNNTVPAVKGQDGIHPQKYTIAGLAPNGSYFVELQCKNAFGLVSLQDKFYFYTPSEEDVKLGQSVQGNRSSKTSLLSSLLLLTMATILTLC